MKRHLLLYILFFSLAITGFCQERVLTAGVQFKPIFASNFLNTGPVTTSAEGVDFTVSQKFGYCAGMVVRYGITKAVSFETGINFVRRNFDLNVSTDSLSEKSDFGIVGYEIPLSALVFIRLSEKIYMNGSTGISLDFYPSDVFTLGDSFKHVSWRKGILSPSLIANIGFEYRTANSGYFYIGGSFHRPFSYIYQANFQYDPFNQGPTANTKLSGNYLTIDFRYFFHEVPIEPRSKREKKEKKGKKE